MAKEKWDRDADFMAIAKVAWPDEFELATTRVSGYGKEYSRRAAARDRMRLRFEGYQHATIIEAKLAEMQRAIKALAKKR